mgnify:CR=1 FL=1
MRILRRLGWGAALVLLPLASGCTAIGGMASSLIGSIFQLALYLAAIGAPIALSYYLYNRND